MTFAQYFLKVSGIALEAAKACSLKAADLEIMEKAYNMGYLVGHNEGFNQGVEYAKTLSEAYTQEFCDKEAA